MATSNTDITLWNWRTYFTTANLEYGQRDFEARKLMKFECDPEGRWAKGMTDGLFVVEVKRAPANYEEYVQYPDWRQLITNPFYRGSNSSSNYYACSCSQGSAGIRCRHLACLMFYWEKQHGPFEMREDEEARIKRLRREREAILARLKKDSKLRAEDFCLSRGTPAPDDLFFQPDAIMKKAQLQTNEYEADLAAELLASGAGADFTMESVYSDEGGQLLRAQDTIDDHVVGLTLSRERLIGATCDCRRTYLNPYAYWYGRADTNSNLCCHALCLWYRLRERIIRENPGDETDQRAFQLLSMLSGGRTGPESGEAAFEAPPEKRAVLSLTPRIVNDRNSNTLKLSFDLSRAGQKGYAVKSLENLFNAVEEEISYSLTKTVEIRFSEERFTEDSMGWYQLIASRVRAVKSFNTKLQSGHYYYRPMSVGNGIPLEEGDLDSVYDLAEGSRILYQYGTRNATCTVRVGRAVPRAELTLDPVTSGNRLVGIALSGTIPRLLQGSRHQYILDTECFGRVGDEELELLKPFQAITDSTGSIRCVIGAKKFPEFYYRVLPALQDAPEIRLTDNVGSLIEAQLPPEPDFTFYIDLTDRLTCQVNVQYADQAPISLGGPSPAGPAGPRDWDQESRVLAAVRHFFSQTDRAGGIYWCPSDEDSLIWILTDGVRVLSQFGEVKGSDAFRRIHVRPAPQPRFSVRVEGGLLDLSVKTRDLSDDELLELLSSYRLKKRWHRLKNGDFVDLNAAAALQELDEAARAMDVTVEQMLTDGVKVPKYRALYVDRLLEDHNDIAASRDRHFKALIRSFQTIRDSDFEASEALMDVLRPYQLYGFRWLSTLAQAGFGGILADEMGLGKTVQMLAYIQAQRQRGEQRPSLVVCPASLVYNWREECRKFAPELKVKVVAGTLSQRKAALAALDEGIALCVTSYDLLKRDITLYDEVRFATVVLDEAQYVKNARAAVSKAVRVLKAEHRFALTGTPIENRLSELWSIFDFLMPGFLYTAQEFAARFEGPIMKQKDADATAALSRMTEPFILRRKKEDVLKDLPEKLEERRCAEMEEDQRKLYDAQLVRMKALLESSGNSGEDKLRILAEITRLRQICCDPSLLFDGYKGSSAKRAACLELIQSAMDGGHRMLVFSQFTSMLSLLASDLTQAGIPFYTLTGATSKQERIRLVNAFNASEEIPVFLISLKAGGTGLNLTGADVVIHYDPWWNLAVQNQATDRAHRIGQTRQVTVLKLITADTIEEKIVELQETKRDLAEAILTGQNTSLMSLSREELMELLG